MLRSRRYTGTACSSMSLGNVVKGNPNDLNNYDKLLAVSSFGYRPDILE